MDRGFLSGRFVSANWDVEDLVRRREEIVKRDLLKVGLNAELGAELFK